jgi:5'-nucleotidase/UDP-sugar diphosphatase
VSHARAMALGLLVGGLLLAGCVSYNEDCTPLVDQPDQVVGVLAGDVDITKARVRTGDNTIGQLVAEAYRHSADDPAVSGSLPPADVGFENAGAIRNEGVCQSNDVIPRGPVRRKTLRQVLPFDDTVSVVSVDVPTLRRVMEHAVAGFSPSGVAATTPPGSFLQLSGVTVIADCKGAAESATTPGARILRMALEEEFGDGGSGATVLLDVDGGVTASRSVRIACNSFLLSGGDGYAMLAGLDAGAAQRLDEQGLNFQIVANHFLRTYGPDAGNPLGAQPHGRWLLQNCAGALPP